VGIPTETKAPSEDFFLTLVLLLVDTASAVLVLVLAPRRCAFIGGEAIGSARGLPRFPPFTFVPISIPSDDSCFTTAT